MLPRFAKHVTIIFVICDEFANSLVSRLQYFWQMLWSVVFWTTVTLLYGVSKSNIAKLQRDQNALCSIIFRLDKMSHVTPFLKKLHWLPIQHRILFKYNLLVFKAINLSQPPYLSALIRLSSLTHDNRLSVSSTCTKMHGFVVAAPAEWNKLPQTVRSQQTIDGFRSQLKTHLFRLAYPHLSSTLAGACLSLDSHFLDFRGFVSILRSINPTIIIINSYV